jgi:A/G-specific adenine glycosylase
MTAATTAFSHQVLAWFDTHGRKDLPWQHPRTAYRVWISEVMLQQTQVATVIPYFNRFLERFPNVATLARAELDEVLHFWTGLGYYARGRNLHATAGLLVDEHAATLPRDLDGLMALPGIGRSTAGAILAAGHGIRAPILDGNVKRVLARCFAVSGYPGQTRVADTLWRFAETNTPTIRVADYTQAIMDLGALVCTRSKPRCGECPVATQCIAHQSDSIERYPGPRPRKTLPVRRVRMFLLTDVDGRCLLERRPPSGIWGGLWSPPERDADYRVDALLAEVGARESSLIESQTLSGFRHTFTHFHMDIEPLRIEVRTASSCVADLDRWRWYSTGDNEPLGLSAVAVRLLALIAAQPVLP